MRGKAPTREAAPLDLTKVVWFSWGDVRSILSADTVVVEDVHKGKVVLKLQ